MPPEPRPARPGNGAQLLVLGPPHLLAPGDAAPPPLQAKRLLLLTYLALEGTEVPVRRDKLLALFWPELETERARHALRQAVHQLRHALPEGALVSHGEGALAVDPARLWCDALALRAGELALGAGITDLYRGDLLDGLHAAGTSPELEQWLDGARTEFQRRALAVAWEAADMAAAAGDAEAASELAGWAAARLPDDEPAVRRQMTLLARLGDRAGALRAYEAFAARLLADVEVEPDPETQALAEEIRRAAFVPSARAAPPAVVGPQTTPAVAAVPASPSPVPAEAPAVRRSRWLVPAFVLALLVVAVLAWRGSRPAGGPRPVVAVGQIEVLQRGTPDTLLDAATVSGLLATDLARAVGIDVLSQARVYEFLRPGGGLSVAARRAGAQDVIEGRLTREPDGRLRLELRRVDARRGVIRDGIQAEGRDLFDVVSAATSQVADLYGVAVPSVPIGRLTSRSLVAQRRYQEGLRALGRYDYDAARRAFSQAIAEDTNFAAAAFHLVQLSEGPDLVRYFRLVERIAAEADSAPDRERLQVRYLWATLANEPVMVTYAESLATRFPAEPAGRIALARALGHLGDFAEAAREAYRGSELDSILGVRTPRDDGACSRCEALRLAIGTWMVLDSAAPAELAARELVRLTDSSLNARIELANIMSWQGRHAEARGLLLGRPATRTADAAVTRFLGEVAMRAGDLDVADSLFARDGVGSWWDRAILHRTRGRYRAALRETDAAGCGDDVDEFGLPRDAGRDDGRGILCGIGRALSLSALGRPDRAAEVLEATTRVSPMNLVDAVGAVARARSWSWTLAGVAWADAGDTTRLRRASDSVAVYARQSAYGRDRRVHHHLLGLLALAQGDTALAERELRSAIWSLSMGYPRTNLALGEVLLATGRPAEAYRMVEPATRGTISGMGSHATFTELHAFAARAAHHAGWTEVARGHYAWVARAWDGADPPIQARLAALATELGVEPRPDP